MVPEGQLSVAEQEEVAHSSNAAAAAAAKLAEAEAARGSDSDEQSHNGDGDGDSDGDGAVAAAASEADAHTRTLFDKRAAADNSKALCIRGKVSGGLVGEDMRAWLHTAEDDLLPKQFEVLARPFRLPKHAQMKLLATPIVGGVEREGVAGPNASIVDADAGLDEYLFSQPLSAPLHRVSLDMGSGDAVVRLTLQFRTLDAGSDEGTPGSDNLSKIEEGKESDDSGVVADGSPNSAGTKAGGDGDAEAKDGAEAKADASTEGEQKASDDATDDAAAPAVVDHKKRKPSRSAVKDQRVRVSGSCSGLAGKQKLVLELQHSSGAVSGSTTGDKKKKKKKGASTDAAAEHGAGDAMAGRIVTLQEANAGDFSFDALLPNWTTDTSIAVLVTFHELQQLLIDGVDVPGDADGDGSDKPKKKKHKAKPLKKGAKPPQLLWQVRPRAVGETQELDAGSGAGTFLFRRLVPASVNSTLEVNVGPLGFDLQLIARTKKRGTGSAALVLDGDEDSALVLEGDQEPSMLSRGFTFPQFVEEGADFKVQVSTDIPCDLNGRVHTKSGKPVPLLLEMETRSQKLIKVKGELDGLGHERLLILELELEWNGSVIETSEIALTENGEFEFQITALDRAHYKVFVKEHPHAQTTTLTSFAGVLHGGKDIDNVRAVCTDNPWEIGGVCTGLKPGLSCVALLRLSTGVYSLSLDAIGPFVFAIPVAEGTRYTVEFKDPMKQMAFLRKHGIKLWVQHQHGTVVQPAAEKEADEAWKAEFKDPLKRPKRWTGVHNVRLLPTIRDPAISRAAALGDADEIVRLLEHGHDVEYRDKDLRTALFGAAEFGQVEAMSVLLSRIFEEDLPLLDGADATDTFGMTPFMKAAQSGHLESVKQLQEMEVELQNEDETDRDALFLAAYNDHADVARHLLQKGSAHANVTDLAGLSPLLVAAQCGNLATLRVLLEEAEPPADLHFCHHSDGTALIHAAAQGHTAAVEYLLEQGAGEERLELTDGETGTEKEKSEDKKEHKKHKHKKHKHKKKNRRAGGGGGSGAPEEDQTPLPTSGIDTPDLARCTALTRAALGNHFGLVRLLAERGARLDPRGRASETPLLMASRLGHFEVVRELLQAGCDAQAQNHWGENALDIAKDEEQEEVLELLLEVLGDDEEGED
eukprot:g5355.t1